MMRTPKLFRSRSARPALLAVAVVLAATSASAHAPPERGDLCDRSARIATTSGWCSCDSALGRGTFYRWTGPRTILTADARCSTYELVRLPGGRRVALRALSAKISRRSGLAGTDVPGPDPVPPFVNAVCPAPGGCRVLVIDLLGHACVADLRRQAVTPEQGSPYSVPFWMVRDTRWAEILSGYGPAGGELVVHDARDRRYLRCVHIPAGVFRRGYHLLAAGARRSRRGAQVCLVFADGPAGRVRACYWRPGAAVTEIRAIQTSSPVHPGWPLRFALSRDCDRVAWTSMAVGRRGERVVGLWVSDLRAGHPRCLGTVRLPASATHAGGRVVPASAVARSIVSGLAWTPADDRVSFECGGALWVTAPCRFRPR